MPCNNQHEPEQREEDMMPFGFYTKGRYRVELYVRESNSSCSRTAAFDDVKEVGSSWDGVDCASHLLARDRSAEDFEEDSKLFNVILLIKCDGKTAHGFDKHAHRLVVLDLGIRPKGELVFWVKERLGRNDFPFIFTEEWIDKILEGLQEEETFKMAFINSVYYWGQDGSYNEEYTVPGWTIKALDVNLRFSKFVREEWLHRVATVAVIRKAVVWALQAKEAGRAGRKQRTPQKSQAPAGIYLNADQLATALQILGPEVTEDSLVEAIPHAITKEWAKKQLAAMREAQAELAVAPAVAAEQAAPAPPSSAAGALQRSLNPGPHRPAGRSPGHQLPPSHPGMRLLAAPSSPNKRKLEAAGPSSPTSSRKVQGQLQDSISVLSAQHAHTATQEALSAQVSSPQRPPAGALISSSSSPSILMPSGTVPQAISIGIRSTAAIPAPVLVNLIQPQPLNLITVQTQPRPLNFSPGQIQPRPFNLGAVQIQPQPLNLIAVQTQPQPLNLGAVQVQPQPLNLITVQTQPRPLNFSPGQIQPRPFNLGAVQIQPQPLNLTAVQTQPQPLNLGAVQVQPQRLNLSLRLVPVQHPVAAQDSSAHYLGQDGLLVQLPPLPPGPGSLQ